ncbi:MAG: exodeoxyribonuclease VII large subunit [Ornithinimicrobium sp.]
MRSAWMTCRLSWVDCEPAMTSPTGKAPLAPTARETSAEAPWPVRVLSLKIADYVQKMSPLWVEGQIVQLNRRPGMNTAFVTLRDTDVDMSLSVTIPVPALEAMTSDPQPGSRVVVHAKPSFWTKRGTLQLEARQMRHIGVGELLARLEHLKQLLRSEGLFEAQRKRALPFLPVRIGLIVGRNTAAERDVLSNTHRRWPAARFEIRQVPVQGPDTVMSVSKALTELDALPEVDVIVIARGGGSFEDLLPFSNEALIRAVAGCRTPVVSAIGHESDSPLLDFVADLRASTPTHAANAIVPDRQDELNGLRTVLTRGRRTLSQRVARERAAHLALMSRPVMTDRAAIVARHRDTITHARQRGRSAMASRLRREHERIGQQARHLRAVSPRHTLDRGYAVVRHVDATIVRDSSEVVIGELLQVTVGRGDFAVRSVASADLSTQAD